MAKSSTDIEVIKTQDRYGRSIVMVHRTDGAGDTVDYIQNGKVSFKIVEIIAKMAEHGSKVVYKEEKRK